MAHTTETASRRRERSGRHLVPLVLVALGGLLLAAEARAQYRKPPPPAAYALEGVTVVRPGGERTAGANVVVRNGLLQALGPGADVPPDARVLEGDSLFVYPGLVDAAGAAAHEFPGPDSAGDEVPSWDPPRRKQGFLPHRRLAEHLSATGEDLAESRRKGVVAGAVHPADALMPGRSALLLFRADAEAPRRLVLEPELGTVMAFEPASGAYPSTLFGVVAFLRQRLRDASRSGRLIEAYRRDPAGLTPPAWDPDMAVLREVLEGESRVFFRASSSNDIRRVLDLASEFGFRPVIVGGGEAWKVAETLKRRDVPVLVSLDFPTPKRWKPGEGGGESSPPDSAGEEAPTGGEATAPEAPAAGRDTLPPEVLREKERLEDQYRNPRRLADAGVRFALTSGGGEVDLREGARKVIEYGLSEQAALRALTAAPAELLGAPSLARIREGTAANLVVTNGPLFEEDTRVLYTFVAGRLERGARPGEEPEKAPTVDVSGTWEAELQSDRGSFEGTLTLEQEGYRVNGSLSTQFGEMEVQNGTVSGNEVQLTLSAEIGGQSLSISLSGTVEGDEISGTGSSGFGSLTWEAARESGPQADRRGGRESR